MKFTNNHICYCFLVLPFQKEFLIPLRDRAFSWDVSFEDSAGILSENESAPIGVISEQQDSHRLVIRAKAPSNKKPNDSKDLTIETTPVGTSADQSKKGKNNSNSRKKDSNSVSSPTLQAGKANLKATTTSTSSNNNKSQSKNTNNSKNNNNNTKSTTSTTITNTTTRKNYVPSSPSTELLDNQTLINTMTNSKIQSENMELLNLNTFIKPEFPELSNDINFTFGNEFETSTSTTTNIRHNSVTFDDTVMNMNFKTEDDFLDLQNEIFSEEFRPPRKLSWSIDFNAIEAAMNAEGSFNSSSSTGNTGSGTSSGLLASSENIENNFNNTTSGTTGSYLYDSSNNSSSTSSRDPSSHPAFSSMLREMEATGSINSLYNNNSSSNTSSSNSNSNSTMKLGNQHNSNNNMLNSSLNSYNNNNSNELQHQHHSNTTLLSSMTNKTAERDQLASLMSGNTINNAHSHGPTSHSHAGIGINSNNSYNNNLHTNNTCNSNDPSSTSSNNLLNGLTLGGLTVPNDGEFRVGAYTKLERHLKIEAFREKKRTRIWRKQIKYDCRKRLADTRPR